MPSTFLLCRVPFILCEALILSAEHISSLASMYLLCRAFFFYAEGFSSTPSVFLLCRAFFSVLLSRFFFLLFRAFSFSVEYFFLRVFAEHFSSLPSSIPLPGSCSSLPGSFSSLLSTPPSLQSSFSSMSSFSLLCRLVFLLCSAQKKTLLGGDGVCIQV